MSDEVNADFNSDDETKLFGSRQIAEIPCGVFECVTLASFGIEQSDFLPKVCSVSGPSATFVSINSKISILTFTDELSIENLVLDELVDCLGCTEDGLYMIAAFVNGFIIIYDLKNKEAVFSDKVDVGVKNSGTFSAICCSSSNESGNTIFIASSDGSIVVIAIAENGKVGAQVVHPKGLDQVSCAALVSLPLGSPNIALGGNQINLYSTSDFELVADFPFIEENFSAKSLCFCPKIDSLLALFQNGCVGVLCPRTLLCFNVVEASGFVNEITLMSCTDTDSEKIVVYTSLANSRSICLMETESFAEVYSFKVGENAKLVNHFGNSDDVMFLEIDARESVKNQLLLRTIAKSQPEFRLMRLLRQQKYEEAISFATKYQLDVQLVHKAEVAHYANSVATEDTFTKLKTALEKVDDSQFAAESCLKATMFTLAETMELLHYAQMRVASTEDCFDLQEKLFRAHRRLQTFCLLSDDASGWLEFYTGNLLINLAGFLAAGNSSFAGILWRQHEIEILQLTKAENIPTMLKIIPMNIEINLLTCWLESYVPSVLRYIPETLADIAEILHQRVSAVANLESANWPAEALEFCTKAVKVVEPNSLDELSGWLKEWQNLSSIPDSPIQKLNSMHKALSDLLLIKGNIGVRLNLDEYEQLGSIEGIHNLLRKVSTFKLHVIFNNFNVLIPGSSNIDCEEVISTFIEFHVHSCRKSLNSQIWEEKVILLIDFLNSPEKIISCVSRILHDMPVPWSKNVLAFADRAEQFSEECAHVIRKQRKLAKIKETLIKYELLPLLNNGDAHLDINYALLAIFHHKLPSMLEDAMFIASDDPRTILEVHTMYIVHLLNGFQMGRAVEYLQGLKIDSREKLCDRLLVKAECLVCFEMFEEAVEVVAFLLVVSTELVNIWRINKLSKSEVEWRTAELNKRVEAVQNRLKAQEKFGVSVLPDSRSNQEDLLKQIIKEEQDTSASWKKTAGLGKLSSVSERKVNLIFAMEKWLPENADFLGSIFDHSFNQPVCDEEVDLILELAKQGASNDVNLNKLLHIIACSAIATCPAGRITDLLELSCNSSDMSNLLAHTDLSMDIFGENDILATKDPFTSWTFSPIFTDTPVNVASSSKTLNIIHNMDKKLSASNPDTVERFFSNIDLLQIDRCDLLAFCIICKYITTSSKDPSVAKELSNAKKKSVQSLLNKVLLERKADLQLALGLLFSFDIHDALNWLESAISRVRKDCNHLFRMAQLGIDFSVVLKKTDQVSRLARLLKISSWGKRVKKLGLSTQDIMSQHTTDYGLILQQMMISSPEEPLETMFQFCTDFQLDVNYEIIILVETLILKWQPTLEYISSEPGLEKLVSLRDENFEKRLAQLVRNLNINYFQSLDNRLDSIWDKLNVYHYEMFECLLNLRKFMNPAFKSVQSDVLTFLEPYTRSTAPQAAEIDRWMRIHPDGRVLPELAKVRLPFPSFLKDVHDIIRTEVNLKNYTIWIKAPTMLGLDPDEICIAAIKNSIGTEVHLSEMTEWNSHSREKLVEEVSECVSYIKELSSAAAILEYTAKRIPLGQDRITLLDLCHQRLLAVEEEKEPETMSKVEHKISDMLLLYCVVHALHEDNLARQEYLQLATKPDELIDALYRDPSIIERVCGGVGNYPDIHSAVGKIAHIASLDVEKLRFNILGSLLFSESMGSDALDESFVDVTRAWQQYGQDSASSTLETNINLLKARYMLEAGEKQAHMDYIISIINNENISCSNCVHLRAWRLLNWLAPSQAVVDATGIPEADINEHLTNLYFLSELEVLQGRVDLSMQQFKETEKKSFVEGIWRSHSSNPRALMLMARVAVYYKILGRTLWQNILTKMIHLKMENELLELLPKLTSFPNLFSLHPFNRAWNNTISAPFSKADSPMTAIQYDSCKCSLLLLQRCPVGSDIDIEGIFILSLSKGKPELAAVLLAHARPHMVKQMSMEILAKIGYDDLKQRLLQLNSESQGFPVYKALQAIKQLTENGNA
ncbi:kinetochore-associated protein 1 [Neocloeon triangulifer]|uniref:kinetochore-associated protein 1 n=1 Tax=Neocloeon triangulifer TaxID=2078957 RepID=UPI00286F35AF|nr:kinetochore-associated protein 1 [Neocloeon triangulifer]